VIDGHLMYRDDNHLSVDGARYVWTRIGPQGLRGLARYQAAAPATAQLLPR
jgi:hypothetical protein